VTAQCGCTGGGGRGGDDGGRGRTAACDAGEYARACVGVTGTISTLLTGSVCAV